MTTEYQTTDPFATAAFEDLREFLMESRSRAWQELGRYEHFERELHRRIMACEAEAAGAYLKRYDLDADEMEVKGQSFRRKMKSEQEYCGLAGTFVVERTLFVPHDREGRAICPLELRAGIIEGAWTPLAARVMARAVASTTPREAAELFEEWGGMKPSASSLDRLPKGLSETWEEEREGFEKDLRSQEPIPREAAVVAVSIDGVHAPMKGCGRAEKRAQGGKRPQGPAGYREVGCGTLTLYDAEGERLQTIRYARMPEFKKETLKGQLEAEIRSILATRPELQPIGLADGAEDNWDFLSQLFRGLGREEAKEAVDAFHTFEHVKAALDAYHGEGSAQAKAAFEQCRIWLRETGDGAERVLRALRYRRERSRGSARKRIGKEIQYLAKRRDRLRYKQLLDENLPIGSGVVEAACKTLVTERMKRSGMSWGKEGGQAILTLRSLIQSNRWERGWELLSGHYRCQVKILKPAA